ncbi:glycosyltransferase [Diaphorobacter sp.]|uniref:glycosyltransferase n=1 Tax=Diaphorobacter sp. TaxID=1934310 RepID=UPI0033900F5B
MSSHSVQAALCPTDLILPTHGLVTVSIVSHGQLSLILPLLEQLNSYSAPFVERVVLTMNVPEEDVLAGLSWRFTLDRVYNESPLGFGANHNRAFAYCRSPWFLVLNPDIRLVCDVLQPLMGAAHSSAGLLAPRVVEPGAPGPEPYRRLVTPWEVCARRWLNHVPPGRPHWIPGMFMLFRAQAYQAVGGFDAQRYFMYGEDVDLCARLRLAGWQIQVEEGQCVEHHAQRASHRNWRYLRWHVTSLLKLWASRPFWRYRHLLKKERSINDPT